MKYIEDKILVKKTGQIIFWPLVVMVVTILLVFSTTFYLQQKQSLSETIEVLKSTISMQDKFLVQEIYLHQEKAFTARMKYLAISLTKKTKVNVCLRLNIIKEYENYPPIEHCNNRNGLEYSNHIPLRMTDGIVAKLYYHIESRQYGLYDYLPKQLLIAIIVAILLSLFLQIVLVKRLIGKIINPLLQRMIHQKERVAKGEIALQIAHDIRSPLAALNMVMKNTRNIEEDKRTIMRRAVIRINDIANNLLAANKEQVSSKSEFKPMMLTTIIDSIISEKRTQYRDSPEINIELNETKDSYGIYAKIEASELRRVLSNIINNSVESLTDKIGTIDISTHHKENLVQIDIKDTGNGIPSDMLEKVFEKGVSIEKEHGSGLGLFHALKTIKSYNGSINISSSISKGTVVSIILPKAEKPSWFVPEINLSKIKKIVVADDDLSIHYVWKGRFASSQVYNNDIDVSHFSSPEELVDWHRNNHSGDVLYLIDYEFLGHERNGLDIISELKIEDCAILVTSRFEEDKIQDKCVRMNIKLLAKSLAHIVPITHQPVSQKGKSGNVLIDDDTLTIKTWEFSAKTNGIKLATFEHPDDFIKQMDDFDSDTILYIDSNLKLDRKGEDYAKDFYDKGFKEIYLSTGTEKEKFPEMSWIKEIIGKESPWR